MNANENPVIDITLQPTRKATIAAVLAHAGDERIRVRFWEPFIDSGEYCESEAFRAIVPAHANTRDIEWILSANMSPWPTAALRRAHAAKNRI